MKLRLTDADQERLGAPDVLDCGLAPFPVSEAIAVESATGLSHLEVLELTLPRFVPVPERPEFERWHFHPLGLKVRIWLGLRRAGVEVDFDALDFDSSIFVGVQKADDDEGKATGSSDVEPSTPSKSATSSRRTRSKRSQPST